MNPLRNTNINYFKGWFFVTFQVAMNKSVFGVISDKKLILNALGEMVRENLLGLGQIFTELYIDTAMVMPNHVHVVLKIDSHDGRKDLAYFIAGKVLLARSKIGRRTNIIPVEVKSSKYHTTKSLDKFSAKFKAHIDSPIILHTKDLKAENGMTYLPLYMTPMR